MKFIKPKHLENGDAVGIVSPSSAITSFPRRLARGVKALENLGLKVVLGKNAKNSFGHNGGTAEERADDINNFFADPNIKAIICSTGGLNANAVLSLLDYESIKNNPKIFCGFSDITALNLAINKKTGLITFNGPTVLPTFGEFGEPLEFTMKYFKKALFETKPMGKLEYPKEFTEENLWWETEDDRKRKMIPASSPKIVCEGIAKGVLCGGNFNTLCVLGGTEYFPDFTNTILFLEDEEESTALTERRLIYLEQLKVFDKIKGIIFGRPFNLVTDSKDRNLYDILKYFGEKYKIPILADIDIGHTNPIITLPIGVSARLDATDKTITITGSATS